MRQTPVLIVSAFGRGQSLAARLTELEIPCELIDVSNQLGKSSPEDDEGPFGVFLSALAAPQNQRMHQDDPLKNQETGFNIVLSSGPIELKGPTAKYRLEQLGVPNEVLERFREIREGRPLELAAIKNLPFEKKWLFEVSAKLFSHQNSLFLDDTKSLSAVDLDGDFWVREVTRPGLDGSLGWLERQGVKVCRHFLLDDVARESRKVLKAIEYRDEESKKSELLSFEQLIWCLSSEETKFLSRVIFEKLFPKQDRKAEYFWMRYRLRCQGGVEDQVLPRHSLWIRDLDLPWTHENFLILQKAAGQDLYDAWVKIPVWQRFQRDYHTKMLELVLGHLNSKMVKGVFAKGEDTPLIDRTYEESGPVRFPLFSTADNGKWAPGSDENVYYHSPETWDGHGWNLLFNYENGLFNELSLWWKKREELRVKKMKQEEAR